MSLRKDPFVRNTNILLSLSELIMPDHYSIPSILKSHGAHLKPSAAMVRLRLYDVLTLLPPQTYEGRTY